MKHNTTADKGELLPCPFCGGAPYMASDGRPHSIWMVGCSNCDIQFENYSLEGAKKEWNLRSTNEGQEGHYIEGVNAPRLTRALSLMGCAATESMEALCAPDVMADHINRLTSAIARHLSSKQSK